MVYKRHDIATRIQALALFEAGIPIPRITEFTGIPKRTIYDLQAKAKARGYNPKVSKLLKIEYVEDGARSGRPRNISREQEGAQEPIQNGQNAREENLEIIALEATISAREGEKEHTGNKDYSQVEKVSQDHQQIAAHWMAKEAWPASRRC